MPVAKRRLLALKPPPLLAVLMLSTFSMTTSAVGTLAVSAIAALKVARVLSSNSDRVTGSDTDTVTKNGLTVMALGPVGSEEALSEEVHSPPSWPEYPALQLQLVLVSLPDCEFEFTGHAIHVVDEDENLPVSHTSQSPDPVEFLL